MDHEETRVGKLLDLNLWGLVARDDGSALTAGINQPTRVTLENALELNQGRFGVALVAIGSGHYYTTGARKISDGYLSIERGEATHVPFTGQIFTRRTWNAPVHLRTLVDQGAVSLRL